VSKCQLATFMDLVSGICLALVIRIEVSCLAPVAAELVFLQIKAYNGDVVKVIWQDYHIIGDAEEIVLKCCDRHLLLLLNSFFHKLKLTKVIA